MALRKVFGADISKVSILIVRDILKWILLANGFAWTLSYFLMEWWLTGFAYRISIGLGVFVIALFISIVIALLTIYQQVNQIAKVTPAEILKYE
jgi:ABC-type antimicrobial peptide transport system permease subunit